LQAPQLETERLRLRGHRAEDFADCAKLWADPIVTRFFGGTPKSSEEAWARLLRYAGHWSILGFGYWVVEEKASGAYLGDVGFSDYKRMMEPSIAGIPEAGWVFMPDAHGKGFGLEAGLAIHAWGRSHFKGPRTTCIINPENIRSLRLAEKLGYRETLRTTYRNAPTVLLHREW
jgi:RimJ/RimL family protein N-acetyltransferase